MYVFVFCLLFSLLDVSTTKTTGFICFVLLFYFIFGGLLAIRASRCAFLYNDGFVFVVAVAAASCIVCLFE